MILDMNTRYLFHFEILEHAANLIQQQQTDSNSIHMQWLIQLYAVEY